MLRVAGIILFLLAASADVLAAEHTRTSHRVGVVLSGHGSPAPSMGSAKVAVNVTDFLRLDAGAGVQNSYMTNGPRYAYNYTLAPIFYGASWLGKCVMYGIAWVFDGFGKLITTGHIRTHLDFNKFWPGFKYDKYTLDTMRSHRIFSFGGGGSLMIPGTKFSPIVGVNWARFRTSGAPYGLPDSTSHVYYSGGLDYQGDRGGNIGAGFNWCPNIKPAACGFFVNLGKFF